MFILVRASLLAGYSSKYQDRISHTANVERPQCNYCSNHENSNPVYQQYNIAGVLFDKVFNQPVWTSPLHGEVK